MGQWYADPLLFCSFFALACLLLFGNSLNSGENTVQDTVDYPEVVVHVHSGSFVDVVPVGDSFEITDGDYGLVATVARARTLVLLDTNSNRISVRLTYFKEAFSLQL